MNQKTIFITGAAAGIGKATALLFAKKGWFVGLFDLDEQALNVLHQQIGIDKACVKVTDVAAPKSVKSAADYFSKQTQGRMDVLFNNAGILRMGTFRELDLIDHKKTLDVNVNGLINCTHICYDMLAKTPNAHIINMSSASAFYGIPELSSYSASKFAVRSLTESLNIEFECDDITVCDIAPGYVKTPMLKNQVHKAKSLDKIGITLTPENVAEKVWQSAHSKKIHHYMGMKVKVSPLLSPFTPIMKRVMKAIT